MTSQEILDRLKEKFGKAIVNAKVKGVYNPYARIKSENVREIAFFLRDDSELQFDYLMCLSGLDLGKGMLGVVYHLNSISKKHKFTLKVDVTRENPNVPSVEMVWKTANWHEREAYDLFGINFQDHPDLRRILLPDDWDGYPLRKDYQVQEYYNGIKVPY